MSASTARADNPREKKINASAAQLLDATAGLLSERWSLEVTFSDIARRSGLNSALIKYYFGSKEGLLLALLERDAKLAMAALGKLVAADMTAERKLRLHINGVINAYHRSPYLNRLIHFMVEKGGEMSKRRVVEVFVEPMVAAYQAIIEQGVNEGAFRAIDPAFLYYSLMGSCEHIFQAAYSLPATLGMGKISDDVRRRYVEHVTEICVRGLAASVA